MSLKIIDSSKSKTLISPNYNFVFDKQTGFFARWGKTKEEDPQFAPMPEILDIEIVNSCQGVTGYDGVERTCSFCYKSNIKSGKTGMSLDTFKKIFDKLPKSVCQIAFGVDSTGLSNPDMLAIMKYTKEHGVIPNVTLANVSDELADQLVGLVGAVAISRYENRNICYDSVKRLTDRGLKQCNIHIMVCQENYKWCLDTIYDRLIDPRLAKLNSIVFLSLKQKGRGTNFHPVSQEDFKKLIDKATELNVSFGMDSCSAHKFLTATEDYPNKEELKQIVEPCESSAFSFYIDVNGKCWPCSFCPGMDIKGQDILLANNFQDIWNSEETKKFRNKLLACNRQCSLYKI
jgi:MoaA/NifB/PqqE/SkfB family radical SAM enzyme